jgi:hypothetical protein
MVLNTVYSEEICSEYNNMYLRSQKMDIRSFRIIHAYFFPCRANSPQKMFHVEHFLWETLEKQTGRGIIAIIFYVC